MLRRLRPLALLCAAALLALGPALGCATHKEKPPPAAPAPQPVAVDFSALFAIHTGSGLYDERIIHPELLARVQVGSEVIGAATAGGEPAVDPWLRRVLLSHLGNAGAYVFVPMTGKERALPAGDGSPRAAPPTSQLRATRFFAAEQSFPVIVAREEDGSLSVHHRAALDAESLCGSLQLRLSVVQLDASVVRLPEGTLAATLSESTIPAVADDAPVVGVEPTLPACTEIRELFEASKGLRPGSQQLQKAAEDTVEAAFRPLPSPPSASGAAPKPPP